MAERRPPSTVVQARSQTILFNQGDLTIERSGHPSPNVGDFAFVPANRAEGCFSKKDCGSTLRMVAVTQIPILCHRIVFLGVLPGIARDLPDEVKVSSPGRVNFDPRPCTRFGRDCRCCCALENPNLTGMAVF